MDQQPRSTADADDLTCVRSALSGDQDGYVMLVQRYTDVIFTLSLRALGNRHDAEDAVQEIFARAFAKLGRFNQHRRFFSWLYTIALNHLRSRLRRRGYQGSEELPVCEELLLGPAAYEPERELMAGHIREMVGQALKQLSPRQRQVFVLRQIEGLSTRETSRLTGVPENTVKTDLRRARQKIAEYLRDDETPDTGTAYMMVE